MEPLSGEVPWRGHSAAARRVLADLISLRNGPGKDSPEVAAVSCYGFRAHGPCEPERGLRFDPEKLLLDPYGLVVAVLQEYSRAAARRPGDNTAFAMESVVADPQRCDWEGDRPLRRSLGRVGALRAPRARLHQEP